MQSTEELLIRVLNHLAERMRERLILKGGMLLRLLESPRSTQDLDFALISGESKKSLSGEIISILKDLKEIEIVDQDLNSRGIFIDVRDQASEVQGTLEINIVASTFLPPEPISTARLANRYSLTGRVVSTMALPEAFSNKIAACLERGAARDLYDLSLFEPMTTFDAATLRDRLGKAQIDRAKPKRISPEQAGVLLQERLDALTKTRIRDEILPLLPKENMEGLQTIIRASVSRVIQKLKHSAEADS